MHPKMQLCAHFTHLSPSRVHHQLAHLVCMWLTDYDPNTHFKKTHTTKCQFSMALVDVVASLVRSLSGENHTMVTIISFMYAQRFIREVGINHDSVVNVLIVSTMLAVKYWDDIAEVNNSEVAEMAGLSLSYINKIERMFLLKVNYNLNISAKEINAFCYQLVNESFN